MVGAEGFEPPTLCSQSRCATRLRYAPTIFHDCSADAIPAFPRTLQRHSILTSMLKPCLIKRLYSKTAVNVTIEFDTWRQ